MQPPGAPLLADNGATNCSPEGETMPWWVIVVLEDGVPQAITSMTLVGGHPTRTDPESTADTNEPPATGVQASGGPAPSPSAVALVFSRLTPEGARPGPSKQAIWSSFSAPSV